MKSIGVGQRSRSRRCFVVVVVVAAVVVVAVVVGFRWMAMSTAITGSTANAQGEERRRRNEINERMEQKNNKT